MAEDSARQGDRHCPSLPGQGRTRLNTFLGVGHRPSVIFVSLEYHPLFQPLLSEILLISQSSPCPFVQPPLTTLSGLRVHLGCMMELSRVL